MSSDDTVDAAEEADPKRWLSALTYEEIHALQIGASLGFLAAAASSPYIFYVALSVLLWALGIRCSPHRRTSTGDSKQCDHEQREGSGMSRKFLGQIRRETHYYIGGLIIGDRVGWYAHQWLFDTAPNHYDKLPEIIRMLTGGL